jgi:hypothetical protein
MARRVVVGDLRVQQIQRRDGRRSRTIVWPEGTEYPEADRFLRRHEGSPINDEAIPLRTYMYVTNGSVDGDAEQPFTSGSEFR